MILVSRELNETFQAQNLRNESSYVNIGVLTPFFLKLNQRLVESRSELNSYSLISVESISGL